MARQETNTQRREDILTHAASLFQELGFGGATMRELAERVGIEAASLYNHFTSKQAMLAAICTQVAEAYMGSMAAIEANKVPFAAKVEALLRLHVQLAHRLGPAVAVAGHEFRHLSPESLETYLKSRRAYEQHFEALLTQGMAAGEFAPHPPRLVLLTLLAAVRWVENPPRHRPQTSPQELEQTLITLLLNGLRSC